MSRSISRAKSRVTIAAAPGDLTRFPPSLLRLGVAPAAEGAAAAVPAFGESYAPAPAQPRGPRPLRGRRRLWLFVIGRAGSARWPRRRSGGRQGGASGLSSLVVGGSAENAPRLLLAR